MRRMAVVALLALAFAALIPVESVRADVPQLPPAVTRALARADIPADSVSLYVREANSDEVLVALNEEAARSPASTIKVLTTFAALDMLGPAYTWKTRVYLGGPLTGGTLDGDLTLVGGGDPYLTAERWWSFVQNLRALGLERIAGDLVIDNTLFAPTAERRGDFDNQPFRSYNVLPDALMVNFQTSNFTMIAHPDKARPEVTINPHPANLVIRNQLRVGPGRCQGYNRGVTFDMPDPDDPNTIAIRGVLAAACGRYAISRAVMTAPDYAYGTFRTFWTQSGGQLDGTLKLAPLAEQARLFHTFESVPLADVIRLVNKFSNNMMARHLLLTLGLERYGAPATVENGREAVRAWLAERGIEIPGFVLDNGSGLSRIERLTARGLGEVLDAAWHSPFMPELAASLPLAALDGTLRQRFDVPGMQGRLRMKTGRLDHVSGLAGYVHAASGRTFVVVILVNHPGAHTGSGERLQTDIVRWVFDQ